VQLPPALEALRRREVANAADGVPAHITLLFPSLPLYGGAFDFERHVSIVEGSAADAPEAHDGPAALPRRPRIQAGGGRMSPTKVSQLVTGARGTHSHG
jgi:hypothetical protein